MCVQSITANLQFVASPIHQTFDRCHLGKRLLKYFLEVQQLWLCSQSPVLAMFNALFVLDFQSLILI